MFCSTQSQVPGMTCITPRAFAGDTTPLLKPLSWYAIAAASEPETPWPAAVWPISPEVVGGGVGDGAAWGMLCGAAVEPVPAAPFGSFSAVPDRSGADGSRPFIHASSLVLTPERAAMPESVSPGCTV